MLNVACWNSFVVWMMNNPQWNGGNLAKRRLFLKELAERLIKPYIRRQSLQTRLQVSVQAAMELYCMKPPQDDIHSHATSMNRSDRGRCHMCEKRHQVRGVCILCHRVVCNDHSTKGSICLSRMKYI